MNDFKKDNNFEIDNDFNNESYLESIQNSVISDLRQEILEANGRPIAPEKPTEVTQEQPTEEMKAAESSNETKEDDDGMLSAIGDFFKELPSQAAGGVIDALNNTLQTAKDMGEDIGIPDYAIQLFDKDGNLDIGLLTPEEIEEAGGRRAQIAPNVEEADTVAAGFARAITQFATGFIPVSKGLQAAGMAGGVARGLAAGGIADAVTMDPHQARLATLLNEVPALQDVVPDYLADNNPENESAWEGRIKNALEGLGLGVGSEALIKGTARMIKAYKTMSKAPTPVKTASKIIEEDSIADMVEDLSENMIDEKIIDLGPEELLYNEGGITYLNHNRINSVDDIKNVMQNMADQFDMTDVMSLDQMERASSSQYKEVTELLGREIDRPFSASEAIAARKLMTSSAEKLTELAKIAVNPMASPEDMFKFRRSMQVHSAIQEVVLSGRRATARALKSWDISTGSTKMRLQQITDLMESNGKNTKQLAEMIVDTANNDGNVSATINKALSAKWKDAYYQVWINGLLSSPSTHGANIISNMATTMLSIPERYITSGFDAIQGIGGESLIQANARAAGFFNGLIDGFQLITGKTSNPYIEFGSKLENRMDAISASAWGKQPNSIVGKGIDYIGRFIGIPGWALEKGDLFFKGINYRMMLNEQAAKQALSEGLTGKEFKERIVKLVSNPTDSMKNVSSDFARYQTFQNKPGKIAYYFDKLRNVIPGGKYLMPFVRTPANILTYGFERTPVALLMSDVRNAIKSGGPKRAEALARMSAGSLLMSSVVPFVLDGTITGAGPADYRERNVLEQTGWQPYSVKIGDKYISYDRLEPISTLIGYSADIASIMGQLDEEDSGELIAAGLAAFSRNLTNKTFLSGITQFVDVLTSNSAPAWENFASRQLAGFIQPVYSSAIKKGNYFLDNVKRDYKSDDVNGFLKSTFLRAADQVPGMGKNAPPIRDIWGEPRKFYNGVAKPLETLSPIKIKKEDPDPVNKMIAENNIPLGLPRRIVQGVRLTNKEYATYCEYAGKLAKGRIDKAYNMGFFDKMSDGPEGQKALYIKRIVTKSRQIARRKMLIENPELKNRIRMNKEETKLKLMGEM